MSLDAIRERYDSAVERMHAAADACDHPSEGADEAALRTSFDEALTAVEDAKRDVEHAERIEAARAQHAPARKPVGADVRVVSEPDIYGPEAPHSFFRDLMASQVNQDPEAAERIRRYERGQLPGTVAQRDVTSGGGGAGVIPPVYLPSMYAGLERYGRPFVSSLPKLPLPSVGTSFTLPKVATGSSAAYQGASENSALSETDMDINTVTVYVATLGGIQDYSIQTAERSDPAFDAIVARDLMEAYWQASEVAAFAGAGTAGLIMGIENVGSIQTVTWTEATPTQADFVPKLYDGIQKVYTNHYRSPDRIVMHPRRSSWLAAGTYSGASPIFQQGALMQASGAQDMGQAGTLAGLPVIVSPAITTTNGSGTNEDKAFVLNGSVMPWMESATRVEVFRSPGSANGTIRFRIYGYGAFVSARFPNAICEVSGTGLVTPSF